MNELEHKVNVDLKQQKEEQYLIAMEKMKMKERGFSFLVILDIFLFIGVMGSVISKVSSGFSEVSISGIVIHLMSFLLILFIFGYGLVQLMFAADCLCLVRFVLEKDRPIAFHEFAGVLHHHFYEDDLARIDRCLDYGVCPDRYLNYALGYMMYHTDLSLNEMERDYLSGLHKSAYPCLQCGGVTHLLATEPRICAYCNQPLVEYQRLVKGKEQQWVSKMKDSAYSVSVKKMLFLFFTTIFFVLFAILFISGGIHSRNQKLAYDKADANFELYLGIGFGLVFLFIAVKALIQAMKIIKGISFYPKIKEVVERENRPLSYKYLANEFHMAERKVRGKIDAVLDLRVMPDLYLNDSICYMLYRDDIKNEMLQYDYLEKYNSIRYVCKNCGGESILKRYQNKICSFCGNRLE